MNIDVVKLQIHFSCRHSVLWSMLEINSLRPPIVSKQTMTASIV